MILDVFFILLGCFFLLFNNFIAKHAIKIQEDLMGEDYSKIIIPTRIAFIVFGIGAIIYSVLELLKII